jgi:N,N-dimethylformamidase
MSRLPLRGYCDRPNVAAGESLDFFVNDDLGREVSVQLVELIHGDPNPDGPGFHCRDVGADINGHYRCAPQFTQLGGFVAVQDQAGRLSGAGGFTLHLYVCPELPERTSSVISRWSETTATGWKLEMSGGRLRFCVGDGTETAAVTATRPLVRGVWYAVCATFDPAAKTLRLHQRAVVNAYNSRLSRTTPLDTDGALTAACSVAPADAGVSVIIAGSAIAAGEHPHVTALFNGKIDSGISAPRSPELVSVPTTWWISAATASTASAAISRTAR